MAPRETRLEAGSPQQLSPAAAAGLRESLKREEPQAYAPQKKIAKEEESSEQKWIPRARKLHEEYVTLREAYFLWASDDTRARKVYLAGWCQAFREKEPKKYGSKLAAVPSVKVPEPLDVFMREYERQSAELRKAYEQKALYLVRMMEREEFRAEFDLLEPDEKDELFAQLVVRLGESEVGRTFFAVQLETPTSLLMTSVFKSTRKANTAFWRVLAEAGGTLVLLKKEEAVVFVETLVATKIDVLKVDILRARYVLEPAGTLKPVRQQRTITILTLEKSRTSITSRRSARRWRRRSRRGSSTACSARGTASTKAPSPGFTTTWTSR